MYFIINGYNPFFIDQLADPLQRVPCAFLDVYARNTEHVRARSEPQKGQLCLLPSASQKCPIEVGV